MHARQFITPRITAVLTTSAYAIALILSTACAQTQQDIPAAAAPRIKAGTPSPDEEAKGTQLAKQADTAMQQGKSADAQKLRHTLTSQYPATAAGAGELLRQARAAEQAGKNQEAAALYEKILQLRPSLPGIGDVAQRCGATLLKQKRYTEAVTLLGSVYRAVPPEKRGEAGTLYAQALLGRGDQLNAVRMYVKLLKDVRYDAARQQQWGEQATGIIEKLPMEQSETLWKEADDKEDWVTLQPVLAWHLAQAWIEAQRFDDAEKLLTTLTTRFPQSTYATQARGALEQVQTRLHANAHQIGVILPLSGPYRQYGERALAAIKMVFQANSPYTLVVKDNGDDTATATQAVEDLVLKDHVIAIIGPLFSAPAVAAAHKAQELGVPMLSLSHQPGLPQIGPYIFRTALTVEAQAKMLAKSAFDEMHMSRFAILYPRNRYGQDFAKAFAQEVSARHGEIRGIESYEPNQTTFSEPIRKLVGRWEPSARKDYREGVKAIKAQKLSSHKEQAAIERLQKSLYPIVDFDGIVLPDSARNIGLVAPALAFEDIVLTHDPKLLDRIKQTTGNAEVKPVTLLGGSTWNTPMTLDSCDRYCEEAVFVDAFFADSAQPAVRDFVTAFRDVTQAEPHLSEAQAYDTAGLLKSVLQSSNPKNREALQKALETGVNYAGVTGRMTFDADGEVQRDLLILTIQDHGIRIREKTSTAPRG